MASALLFFCDEKKMFYGHPLWFWFDLKEWNPSRLSSIFFRSFGFCFFWCSSCKCSDRPVQYRYLGFYWVFTGFYRVFLYSPGFESTFRAFDIVWFDQTEENPAKSHLLGIYRVLPITTKLQAVWNGLIWCYWRFLDFTGFLPSFSLFCRIFTQL